MPTSLIDDAEYARIMRGSPSDGGRSPGGLRLQLLDLDLVPRRARRHPALPAVRPEGAQPLRSGLRPLLRLRARRSELARPPEGHRGAHGRAGGRADRRARPAAPPGRGARRPARRRAAAGGRAAARRDRPHAARRDRAGLRARPADPHERRAARRGVLRALPGRAGQGRHLRSTATGPPTTCTAASPTAAAATTRCSRAVDLLRADRYRELYAGLLCTIDVRSDPVAVYHALAALEPPAVDFLLPHATWDTPPPGGGSGRDTPYADWLAAVFDAWWPTAGRSRSACSTRSSRPRAAAPAAPRRSGWSASDAGRHRDRRRRSSRPTRSRSPTTARPRPGLDIFSHPLDEAAAHPAIQARQQGLAGLSAHLPPVPGGDQLRRRPVRPPVPDGHRLRQPVGLLRRPGEDHHSRRAGLRPQAAPGRPAALGAPAARRPVRLRSPPGTATRAAVTQLRRAASGRAARELLAAAPRARRRGRGRPWPSAPAGSSLAQVRREDAPAVDDGARSPVRAGLGRAVPACRAGGRGSAGRAGQVPEAGLPGRRSPRRRRSGRACRPRSTCRSPTATVPAHAGPAARRSPSRPRRRHRRRRRLRGARRRRASGDVQLAERPQRRSRTGSRSASCARAGSRSGSRTPTRTGTATSGRPRRG